MVKGTGLCHRLSLPRRRQSFRQSETVSAEGTYLIGAQKAGGTRGTTGPARMLPVTAGERLAEDGGHRTWAQRKTWTGEALVADSEPLKWNVSVSEPTAGALAGSRGL